MTKIHNYPDDATTKPISDDDYLDMDNTDDGGLTWNVSKKIKVIEFITYIRDLIFGGGGTTGTIPVFDPDGTTLGDSPLEVNSGNVDLPVGNMAIRVASDPTTMLYVVGGTAATDEYVGWFETGWIASAAFALNAVADGAGSQNTGIDAEARNATVNKAVLGRAGGSSPNDIINNDSLTNIGGAFSSKVSEAENSAGIISFINGSSSGTVYGLSVLASNSGAGDVYALRLKDGSEGIGKILTDVTGNGDIQLTTLITPSEFLDSVFRIQDEGDNTKKIAFQASGITTATTRTYGAPDYNGELVIASTPVIHTPSGTTQTIDWNEGLSQSIDLGSVTGDVTLTLSNPVAGQSYMIPFIQGATPYDVVLPSNVLIAGGAAPTTLQLTVIDDAIDTLTLWYDGTNYLAQFGENYG